MSCKTVTLILPGYTLENPVGKDDAASTESVPADTASFTGTAFDFTDQYSREPWQSQFANLLGLGTVNAKHLPTARLALNDEIPDSASAETEFASNRGVIRADPIFLKADRDSARLIPAEQLALSEADADALLKTINDFVSADGLTFFKRSASQWYMSGMQAEALESYPPSFLANRNASSFLPGGESMAPWRRLMTELQMLLHSHPLNLQRETAGLMPVNSIWFWGGGDLPAKRSSSVDVSIFADHEQAADMARYHDVPCLPLAQLTGTQLEELDSTQTIILDTSLVGAWLNADGAQLEQSLARINHQWLAPLIEQVRAGQLTEVNILTEDGLQGTCNMQSVQNNLTAHRNGWLKTVIAFFNR